MPHLFSQWPKIEPILRKRRIFLFLDYDGTLTSIVRRPSLAKLSREGKTLLRRLSKMKGVQLALVSGRSLRELKRLVGIRGIGYAGNHGLEFEGPRRRFLYRPALRYKSGLARLSKRLQKALRPFQRVLVENKGLTLSVHYRELRSGEVAHARRVVWEKTLGRGSRSPWKIRKGKKVWEIWPPVRWDKGKMVVWILRSYRGRAGKPAPVPRVQKGNRQRLAGKPVVPIYLGDDKTDEDAFKAIRQKGLGIRVTKRVRGATAACYSLRSPREVLEFLKRGIAVRERGSHAR